MTSHGGARTRSLAAELKCLRLAAGFTLQEVSDAVGVHISTLSRAETGVRALNTEDTSAVLAVYRVVGSQRARLMRLARYSRQPEWWEPSVHMDTLLYLESTATHITHTAMLRVPGMLQTPDYARTVMLQAGLDGGTARARVEVRLSRQDVLTKQNPPRYLAILDETVLRRVTGSRELMVGQVNHIIEAAELPNVEVRVVPFEHGQHPGLDGSFVLMRFASSQSTVYFEQPTSSMFVDAQRSVEYCERVADNLIKVAWSSADSLRFLHRLAAEFARSERSGSL